MIISYDTVDKIYKYSLISLFLTFILCVSIFSYYFYSVKDCNIEYAQILEWGYQNNTKTTYGENPYKFFTYKINNNTITKYINESGDLKKIQNIFLVGDNYIFTICNNDIKGISRRNWINNIFYYKLAQIL